MVLGRLFAHVIAEANTPQAGRARAALIKCAEKRNAALGVMFPAVFAVEDDANQGGLMGIDGLADAVEVSEEVIGGLHAGTALVVEADHIAENVIAKDDAERGVLFLDAVGAIKIGGIDDVARFVAADESLSRLAKNLFVGGDPFDAVLSEQRD